MYKTIFTFENREEAKVLIEVIADTLLEWSLVDNVVTIYEELEEDAEFNKDTYLDLMEEKEIYVEVGIVDTSESKSINYYDEYGLKESDFI